MSLSIHQLFKNKQKSYDQLIIGNVAGSLWKQEKLTEADKRMPYTIVAAPNGDAHIQIEVAGEKKTYSPQEIAAMVLGFAALVVFTSPRLTGLGYTSFEDGPASDAAEQFVGQSARCGSDFIDR
jgi:hypothetical protein